MKKLGTIKLSNEILGKANIGLWAFELDEGKPPRMYVDDTMLALLGLDHQVSPEETYHTWYDRVDKDSYGSISDTIAKMTAGEHAEAQYPWHHPDGRTVIVRCGGVRNPNYKAGIRIEGTHQNITEVLHYCMEELRREKEAEVISTELKHEKFRAEVLSYVYKNNEDPIGMLTTFAEKFRKLFKCDQLVYRNLYEVCFMHNSPKLGKTWSIPLEYCRQCDYYDACSEVYKDGVVELDDCQKGIDGVPTFYRCPIKSSLSRIVYLDGKVDGYLTVRYIKGYHEFTDIERKTFDDFTKVFSLSISKYKAMKKAVELENFRRYSTEHVKLRADALTFINDHDANPNEFLEFFGRQLLWITGCDQVIFRGSDGENAVLCNPDVPAVNQKYCDECPFSNIENSIFAGGVAEMPEYSKGLDGVKPHKKCPVKSGYIQSIYVDGKLRGMLSAHYIKETHEFTEIDRRTWAMFANLLGISLRRIAQKQREQELKIKSQKEMAHTKLKLDALSYFRDHEGNPVEFLKFFAERLRRLIDCDQVIYRNLNETLVMQNSPEIEKLWSVPIEYCQQCEHFDAHNPIYSDGVTEMEDCQQGFRGVPTYHKCPIKSSLTRIVYLDGKVDGYLAIHYVLKHHKFTDIERDTLEEFANILSLSLSRYTIQDKNRRLIELQRELTESKVLSDFFVGAFAAAFYVHLKKDKVVPLHIEDFWKKRFAAMEQGYFGINTFIAENVHPEDQAQMFKILQPEYIQEKLKKEKEISAIFRETATGKDMHFKLLIIRGEDKNHIAIGIADVDEAVRHEEQVVGQIKDLNEKLLESSIKNSMSQMQPHFLYNALASIREIILDDPEYASDLVYDFTTHLRACIKSMDCKDLIPFEQELSNIKAYVNIEKMRFGDRLKMEYDLGVTDFKVVPLGLQPLVENAIKHGIVKKASRGGTVKIKTFVDGEYTVIQVIDDGVGFDYEQIKAEVASGKRDSTGMKNFVLRFEKMMKAKVDIDSKIGVGTTISIRFKDKK